jgi:hypothetical protein
MIGVDLAANFERYLANRERKIQVCDSFPLSKNLIAKELDDQIEQLFLDKRELFIELSCQQDSYLEN